MQKKMINLLLGLLFLLDVAGCSSLPVSGPDAANPDVTESDIFVDPAIARYMGTVDRMQLQTLVATAQPQHVEQWGGKGGDRFEFTSIRIYVNEQGQGCRQYRVTLNRGFFLAHRSFSYAACRDNQGVWKVTAS